MSAPSFLLRARRTLIGDRAFYSMVLMIVVPMIVQNAITNFVSLLDNIMVGRVGTEPMAGVSITNQLLTVFNLCVFGGMSGAGLFAAQYAGADDLGGVRSCFRFKLYLSVLLTVLGVAVFAIAGEPLISLYLNDGEGSARAAETLGHGMDYLRVMLWGLAPFAVTQAYASTLRETGETTLPMLSAIAAVLVNLTFNYILIYGHLGAPAMGVRGAAIATVLSRYVELAVIAAASHLNPKRYPFLPGAYRSLRVPAELVRRIIVKGMPLMVNEALWSLGVATLAQCYSLRGLEVVAALNISNTVANLFNVVFQSMGNATAVVVGQALGARDANRARDHAWKLTAFSVAGCVAMGLLLAAASPFIPLIYNTEASIQALATRLLLVCGGCMPLFAFANCCYFILRSGGKTGITFVFDCMFSWVISIPLAYLLVHSTAMNIVAVYLCVQLADFIKCVLGFVLVRRGIWIQNIVAGA